LNTKTLWIPALIVSLGIVIGCYLISAKPFTTIEETKSTISATNSILVDIEGASKLLGLSTAEINKIISEEKKTLETSGIWEGELFPYIHVDGKIYFERSKLLVWAQDSSSRHRDFHDLSTQ
jgi:hypothetical protein